MKIAESHVALMLGGNLGDNQSLFSKAIRLLKERAGEIEKLSAVYLSEPWGKTDQPEFRNQALILKTDLKPSMLLSVIHKIEATLGRTRIEKNGPREIDIDILLFGQEIINTNNLQIPHPRLHLRNFNMEPLAEIAAHWVHPVLNKTISELLLESTDSLKVHKIVTG